MVHARIALNLIQNLNENAQHLYFEYNSWYEAIQKNVKKRYENLSSKQLKEIRNLLRKAKVLKDDLELKKAVQVLKDFNDLGYLKEVSVKLTRKDNGNSGSVVTVTDHLHDGANRMIERQELLSGEYPIEIKLKKTGMVFRLVPAGNFVMGQKDGRYDELPFDVVISEPFYIGKYEITQQIWAQVMGNNPSFFLDNGAKAPVEQVSWEDIQRFIRKLSKLEGIDSDALHLPTEAQWEYAARGGTQEGHYAKNPEDTAWFVVNANRQTQTVGAKSPNALGLYDMTGNVAELCMDWYDTYPTEKTTDYRGPSNGKFKVYRGGGWFDDESSIRSGKRSRMEPNKKSKEVGFRLIANLKIVK